MRTMWIRKSVVEASCGDDADLIAAFAECTISRRSDGSCLVDLDAQKFAKFVKLKTDRRPAEKIYSALRGLTQVAVRFGLVSVECQKARKAVCDTCEHHELGGKGAIQYEKCNLCGCFLAAKRKLPQKDFDCPVKKWSHIPEH